MGLVGGYIAAKPPVIVPSGSVNVNTLGSGAVQSGAIGSGQVGNFAVASGQILGLLGTTSGVASVSSGTFTGFELGSGAIVSGRVASGQIGNFAVASGQILGLKGVASGTASISSGTLTGQEVASGSFVPGTSYVAPFTAGGVFPMQAGETISGVRAVTFSQGSGLLIRAMASVSGRMPAEGVVVDNVLSGATVNVYTQGAFQLPAAQFNFSGFVGLPVWVSRSGSVNLWSGGENSGGFASGDIGQKVGIVFNSGAVLFNFNSVVWSGGPGGAPTGGIL